MRHLLLAALLCAAAIAPGAAQNAAPGRELESTLTFETTHTGTTPSGWGGGPPSTIFVDGETVHCGRWAARLERTDGASGQPFSTLTKSIPMDFAGTTIEWRGFLRSENVSDFMGLWMRQDGDAPNLAFATMQPRQIKGTNDWTEYPITFPLHRDAKQLFFGVLLGGTGKVWADDLQSAGRWQAGVGRARKWSGRRRRSIWTISSTPARASSSAICRRRRSRTWRCSGRCGAFSSITTRR